ncbi:MAG: glycosyltransferase family 2 protein [Acidimicrobiales bacterium]|nr:glycosyltransferase family 2 protein [Acidimicrobiales bacterium]
MDATDQPLRPDAESASETRAATPSVTALVVAHEPGEWFEETIESLFTQDYPRLDIMVIDAAGDPDLAERLRKIAPDATLLDASDTSGFAAAANTALETDLNSAFLLICHDDVALASDVVRTLVTESLRSNAGITGPKLVAWDNPEQLQHVGLVADRFAVTGEVVEPAELDQEQYDTVTDVFVVPTACLLVRTTLFRELSGYDSVITRRGEDVDLCWRAQLKGARVIVAPDALVRHREQLVERTGVDDIRRTRARHQTRTVMVNSSRASLFFTLPLMAALALGELCIALVTMRFAHVRDVIHAWTWNIGRLSEIRRRRKFVRSMVKASDADVRALQQLGSVRINAFIRGQIGRSERHFGNELVSAMQTGTSRFAVLSWVLVVVFVLFGSRQLLTSGPAAVGDFAAFPSSAGELVSDWWSGWVHRDLGSAAAVPTGYGLAGITAWLLGGSSGFVRTWLVLGPVFVGLVGAWRLLAATGSRRAQIAALVGYAALPLAWGSIAAASMPGLIGFALSPWLLAGAFRIQGSAPHLVATGAVRGIVRSSIGLGTAVGLGIIFEPTASLIVPIVFAGVLVGSLIAVHPVGAHRLVGAAPLVVLVGALVSLPQTIDLVGSNFSWDVFAGGRTGSASTVSLQELTRFSVGPDATEPLVWLLGVSCLVPLLLGRSWRFDLGVRLWTVALSSWGVALVASRGLLDFGLADPALLIAPAAAAVAGLLGLAAVTVEHDLRRAGFGWRQTLVPVALVAAVAGSLPTLGLIESGRWGLARQGFEEAMPFISPGVDGSYRVVWVGAPEILPAEGRSLAGGLAWVATLDGLPTVTDRTIAPDAGSADLMVDVLDSVMAGSTQRSGRLFGGLGVRYVVLLDRLAPAPFSSESQARPIPGVVVEAFGRQLDLRQIVGSNSAMRVYENTEWTSVRAAVVAGFDQGVTELADLGIEPLAGTIGVLSGTGHDITGSIPDGTEILVSQTPDTNWVLRVEGDEAPRRIANGWSYAFVPESGGEAHLSYETPFSHRAAVVAQLAVLILLAVDRLRRQFWGTRP